MDAVPRTAPAPAMPPVPWTAIAALVIASALAGGCGRPNAAPGPQQSASPGPGPTARQVAAIAVSLGDFTIEPRVIRAPAGRVKFEVANRGAIEHDFQIPDLETHHGHEQHLLRPGDTKTLEYTVTPGTHKVVCTIPGHQEAGMTASLEVSP